MLLQIPAILNAPEAARLRDRLTKGRFEDGGITAGPDARAVKRNLQLRHDSDEFRACAPVVLEALRRNTSFYSAALPHRIFGPLFNRYDAGMNYGDHTDSAIMGMPATIRADVAATLFLSAAEDYDGGELVIQHNLGAHRIKFAPGSAVVYPASSIHRVEPVTRGTRYAAVFWIQSLVRDDARRQALFDLDLALGALRERLPGASEVGSLTSVYHTLLRMWAET